MRSRPRVSVIIPAYNEESRIAACLDAIKAQTVPVFEVIVVDNNSTDHTVRIAKKYPFVRVVKEKKQGIVFARNAGFDAAHGDIIGRIDADITLPSGWVAHVQAFYSQPSHKNTAWTGSGLFYNVRFARAVSLVYEILAFGLNRLLLGHHMLWGSNMAMTRMQWLAVRDCVHDRNDIHEDLDLAIHVHQAGYAIHYDRSIKTHARLSRVRTERGKLWDYLQWWPRTLRVHGYWSWFICWFFGALMLYLPSYALVLAEWMAQRFGKSPLPD